MPFQKPKKPFQRPKSRPPICDNRGQASIMIGMMTMTFLLFFTFVINVGMLVNAKINLQNAADLAAYAGAAAQARTLNQISYLNYEMRRQYKKFLFRYYVMGNMAQSKFPRAGSGSKEPHRWSPSGGNTDYGVPTVCIINNKNDNFCHLDKLPGVTIPPPTPLDQVNTTLIEQLTKIEQLRQTNCLSIGFTNTTLLRLWLWNTDPKLQEIQSSLSENQAKAVNTIRALAFGIGLVPREVILRRRIETLKGYLNDKPNKGVTLDAANAMQSDPDPSAHERTLQAFFSAFFTLGNHTFASGDIVMDELINPTQLVLKDIKVAFDAYAVNFEIVGNTTPAECVPRVEADFLQKPVPIGVYKDPSIMTYYAVRLKAKANVLFSPFGTMELKAYAAAQPFGSRIGPQLTDDDYLIKDTKPTLKINNDSTGFHINNALPNLAMRKDDGGAGKGSGFNTDGVLGTLFEGFKDADGKLESVDLAAIVKATHLAMVPNPYEGNKYNIMSDPGTDSFVQNFDNTGVGAFWAPVFPPGKGDNSAEIISIVEGLIGEAGPDSDKFKAGVIKNLNEYLAQLKQGQGEAVNPAAAQSVGEGFNIVRLQDPLRPLGLRKDTPPLSLGNGLSSTDPKEIKTSWNGVLNGAFRAEGRIGYSVKFVSFESLSTKKQKTNDATTWSNDLDADDEFQQDLQFIRH